MPRIFEFHFNPKLKEDLIFDSFCFEPTNIYEKRMGSLYMVGLLQNVLPQNNRFLDVLAEKIKEKYYKAVSVPPEKSLREALKTANEHLEKIAKKGDVSWLGNLNFAAVSLKNLELNFTKVGNLKFLLIRQGQIIDIDQKLKFDEFEPYPLKIFSNIASGKLAENDILLILSQETYDSFLKENLLDQISQRPTEKFKNILNGKKEELTKFSGICLLIVLSKETMPKEKETLGEEKSFEIFSLKKIFVPLLKRIKKISFLLFSKGRMVKIPLPKIIFLSKINFPSIRLPKIRFPKTKQRIFYKPPDNLKKKIVLVLVLMLFFSLGFYVFEKKEELKIKNYQGRIDQIKDKVSRAEYYFGLIEYNPQAKKNADELYQQSWNEISSLADTPSRFSSGIKNQILDLKNDVLKRLEQLNKLVRVSEPELIFEFGKKEFVPQKLIFFKDNICFFSPHSKDIVVGNPETKDKKNYSAPLGKAGGISLAASLSDSMIFFSKPNQIIVLKEDQLLKGMARDGETIYLEELPSDFSFIDLASYRSHLYFLNIKDNSIVRYPFALEASWKTPEFWLAPQTKTAHSFKSIAVDGSIWILTSKNSIERYYLGQLQETISLEVFPEPKNLSKIFTSSRHSYLYVLEPEQKRIIILDKSGQIIKQYQSEKFDHLLDFTVSDDDKIIYLLNGMKVYELSI